MWIICAYFTKNTPYEEHSKGFVESLKRFNLSYDVTAIDSKGDWYTNIQYKPMFLKQMLKKHYPNSIVFVDVDAIFCRYPEHFNKLDNTARCCVYATDACIPEVVIAAVVAIKSSNFKPSSFANGAT